MSLSRFFSHPAGRQVGPATVHHPLDVFFGPSAMFQHLERAGPKMDLVEEEGRVKISLELPALKKEDVEVQLDG